MRSCPRCWRVSERKAALRAELRRKAAELPDEARREIDRCIGERLLTHPIFMECGCVFLYVGVRKEIYTRDLIETAVNMGKIVALPVSLANGVMAFYEYDGHLETGRYGIPEPVNGRLLVPAEADLLVVPGVGFDRHGYRLGQGGGYYDRYMAQHRCKTIGLCREQAFVKEIPISWNDLPVDCVITESAVYEM